MTNSRKYGERKILEKVATNDSIHFILFLKVVTNEKREAVGDVLTIICSWGGGAGCFFLILMGCHLV
jgi:hypothetical protein